MDEEREEYRRLERVAVGRICGCKSCICCDELARHTARMKKTLWRTSHVDEQSDPQFVPPKTLAFWDSFKKE